MRAGKSPNRDVGRKATSARGGSSRDCWSEAGKQGSARRPPGRPFLSPRPIALTLPHHALQPPLRHRRRHLPNTAKEQPPPPAGNLLRPGERSWVAPPPLANRALWERHARPPGGSRPRLDGGCAVRVESVWAVVRPLAGFSVSRSSRTCDVKRQNRACALPDVKNSNSRRRYLKKEGVVLLLNSWRSRS